MTEEGVSVTMWTIDDLHEALTLRGALPGTAAPKLTIIGVTSDDAGASLVLDIDAGSEQGRQRWRLTLDQALADLTDERASLESAALIVRANVEEWWHLKDVEPHTGRMAVLVEG
jgi:hypothetical protein